MTTPRAGPTCPLCKRAEAAPGIKTCQACAPVAVSLAESRKSYEAAQ